MQQLADADSHVSALESKKHEIQRQLDDTSAMYDKVCEVYYIWSLAVYFQEIIGLIFDRNENR